MTCAVDGCEKHAARRGMCSMHYYRWKKYGDPLVVCTQGPPATPVLERIEARTVRQENGCWHFTGSLYKGYGQIQTGSNYDGTRKPRQVHRVAYEILVGPIPEGLQLDHTCHNDDPLCPGGDVCLHRRCWNPAHLEPVTPGENTRRSSHVGGSRVSQKTPA